MVKSRRKNVGKMQGKRVILAIKYMYYVSIWPFMNYRISLPTKISHVWQDLLDAIILVVVGVRCKGRN